MGGFWGFCGEMVVVGFGGGFVGECRAGFIVCFVEMGIDVFKVRFKFYSL